ncbi:TIR domain-containing protein [bacterium]|nr:TIR domain-containing protein [bacterium]
MTDDTEYVAFMSYSHADNTIATRIHRSLESFRVPKRIVKSSSNGERQIPCRVTPIFRDREELPTSDDLGAMIKNALERSRTLVVVCSPNAAKSKWVNQEILTYKRMKKSRIICIIIAGEPNATDQGDPENECFPHALRFQIDEEGNLSDRPAEPIAADMREKGDGRNNAILKVIAGILQIGFDDLKQRHKKRTTIRRLSYLAITLVLSLLICSSVWTYLQGKSQQTKYRIAEENAGKREKDAIEQTEMATILLGQYLDTAKKAVEIEILKGLDDSYDELPLGPNYQGNLGIAIEYSVTLGEIEDLSTERPGSTYAMKGRIVLVVSVDVSLSYLDEPRQVTRVELFKTYCDAKYSAKRAEWDIELPKKQLAEEMPKTLQIVKESVAKCVKEYLPKLPTIDGGPVEQIDYEDQSKMLIERDAEGNVTAMTFMANPDLVGLGIQVEITKNTRVDKGVVVKELAEGGQASRDGVLLQGDIITGIAQGEDSRITPLKGLFHAEVMRLLLGAVDTSVRLEIQREGEPEPLTVTAKRGKIQAVRNSED